MGNLILHAIMGFIIGGTARWFLPGNDSMGAIKTAIIGAVGAWAGPRIAAEIGAKPAKGLRGFLYAVASAMVVLLLLRQL